MSAVEISVVVPVYNAAGFIQETLDALDAQTFRAYEVILVDDGSTDGCGEVMDRYCARHDRFRVLHVENGGEHRARLTGVAQARGKYVCFCDSDDLPLPDMLQKLYERAEETGADITVCGFVREEMGTGHVYSREMVSFEPRAYGYPELWDILPVVNPSMWNKLFRRELLDHVMPMAQPPRIAPDLMFCTSLLAYMQRMAFVPEPLYRYRVRKDSAISRVSAADVALAQENMVLVRDYVLSHNDSPGMRACLDAIAFDHFGWSVVIRQVKGSWRSRAAVASARRFLDEQFPGYRKAGNSLRWNRRHGMRQFRVLVGRWIFCAHLMGPFLVFYDLVTQKMKIEIKW